MSDGSRTQTSRQYNCCCVVYAPEIEGEEVTTEQMKLLAYALAKLNETRNLVRAQLTSLNHERWVAVPMGTPLSDDEESKVSFAPAEL